jgi:DNA-binding transcriptional ArsR family regulator
MVRARHLPPAPGPRDAPGSDRLAKVREGDIQLRGGREGLTLVNGSVSNSHLVDVFAALSDPTRRHVVQLLGKCPHRAGELAEATGMSQPAMSRHLRILLTTGIIEDERVPEDARVRLFKLRPESLVAVQAFLDQLQAEWRTQLRSFKRHVEEKPR